MLNEHSNKHSNENEYPELERLSAYLDDELSLEERAQVERLLAESAEARRELAELEQIRELLRSLPLQTLSDSFPVEVLHQGERQILLADRIDDTAAGDAAPDGHGRPRSSRRTRWLAALAGVSAVAVAGIVALRMDWPAPGEQVADRDALSTPTERGLVDFDRDHRDDRLEEVAIRDQHFRRSFNQSFGDPNAAGSVAGSKDQSKKPVDGLTADANATVTAPAEKQASGGGFAAELRFDQDLKSVEPGQVVRALSRRDGRVSVVRLTVVDRQRVLEELQLLLKRHDIPPDEMEKLTASDNRAASDTDVADAQVAAGANRADQADQFVAVFVEAPGDRLQSAIEDLQRAPHIAGISLGEPVAITMVDPSRWQKEANHGAAAMRIDGAERHNRFAPSAGDAPALTARPNAASDKRGSGESDADAIAKPVAPAAPARIADAASAPAPVQNAPPAGGEPATMELFRGSNGIGAAMTADESAKKNAAGPAVAQKVLDDDRQPVARQWRIIMPAQLAQSDRDNSRQQRAGGRGGLGLMRDADRPQSSGQPQSAAKPTGEPARERAGESLADLAAESVAESVADSTVRPEVSFAHSGGSVPGESKPGETRSRVAGRPESSMPKVALKDSRPAVRNAIPANGTLGRKLPVQAEAAEPTGPGAPAEFQAGHETQSVQLLFVLVSKEDAARQPAAPATNPATRPATTKPPGDGGAHLERSHPVLLALRLIARGS